MAIPVAAIGAGIGLAKKLFGGGGNKKKELQDQARQAQMDKILFDEFGRSRLKMEQRGLDYQQRDSEFGGAIDRVEGMQPTNTAGFSPTRTDAVDTTQLRNMDAAETRGVGFQELQDYGSDELAGLDPGSDLKEFADNESGVDFTARDFDAQAAVENYARGATSDFMVQSGRALDTLRAKSAGAGRADSGLFDKDQGDVITELGRGLTSDIARQSVAAAGITSQSQTAADRMKLDALTSGKDFRLKALSDAGTLRFNRAEGIDRNMLERGKSLGSLQLDRAGTIDKTRADAVRDATGFDLDKATSADKMGLDAAEFQDSYTQRGAEVGLGARGQRADRAAEREAESSNDYLDLLTGNVNRATQNVNANEERKAQRSKGFYDLLGAGANAYATYAGAKR
jgi:hypothetical protein